MSGLNIIHLSDLHLDSPFRGLARRDEGLAGAFRAASLRALSRAVDAALDREADLVTIGGDCFDGRDRSLHAQWYLRNELRRLEAAGIPALLVAGNHDPLPDWSREIGFPESVFFFPADRVARWDLVREGEMIAEVYGTSFGIRAVTENLAKRFPRDRGAAPRIGLLHANVGANPAHDPYAPANLPDLTGGGMDVWLLGHIHQPALLRDRDPLVLYPGCTQGRDPGEAGPRGCYLVRLDGGEAGAEFIPTNVIRWERIGLEPGETSSQMELADRLIDAGEELLGGLEPGEEGAVVRWELRGRSPLRRALSDPDKLGELVDLLTEAFRDRSPYLLTESIAVDLRSSITPEALKGRQDIIGDLVNLAGAAEDDPGQLSELRRALDPVLEEDVRGRRHITAVGDEEMRELTRSALQLGLDRLLPEEPI